MLPKPLCMKQATKSVRLRKPILIYRNPDQKRLKVDRCGAMVIDIDCDRVTHSHTHTHTPALVIELTLKSGKTSIGNTKR